MERRKALAIASAATALVGSGIVAAAALTGASVLGFGGTASAHASATVAQAAKRPVAKERLVVRTRDVYDRVMVETTPGRAAGVSYPTAGATVAADPTTTPTTVGGTTPPAAAPGRSNDGAEAPLPPSSVAPPTSDDPTTSLPGTTPTTRPPGVPDDWPAGTPIPPIPPNCQQPELHLNGVWECSGVDN